MTIKNKTFDVVKIFNSFLFFSSTFFKKREYDIVFYYPAHFNRGPEEKNHLFEPLCEACRRQGKKYIVFEEPTFYHKDKRNKNAIPFDFPFLIIIFFRKLMNISNYESFFHRESKIADLLKPIFFRNFSFKSYIVLSQSMLGFFRGLNQSANLFDLQHGILYSNHHAYLVQGMPSPDLIINNVNVLVFGREFQNILVNNEKGDFYKEHTFIIGYPQKTSFHINFQNRDKRFILFTSTIVDGKREDREKQYKIVLDFFKNNNTFFIENSITILFKHHPRYQYDIDMSELFSLPSVLNQDSLDEALEKSFLHITLVSTTVFEASSIGIPSIVWNDHFENIENIFVHDFNYPLGIMAKKEIIPYISLLLRDKNRYIQDSNVVKEWYGKFYEKFDEKKFINIVLP